MQLQSIEEIAFQVFKSHNFSFQNKLLAKKVRIMKEMRRNVFSSDAIEGK